jgi:energy-coupling factor transporter ATP-binding protein EcfA2
METPQLSDHPTVVGAHFDHFLAWVDETWEQGQHWALIGPTGEGKTTFAVALMKLRKWVIALDPKGGDSTLTASGFQRVTSLPLPRRVRNDVAEGKPARLIMGGSSRTTDEMRALRKLLSECVEMIRGQGGWTLFADEFQILSDLRMFGLGTQVEQLLVAARDAGTSVLTAFQAPAWVPRAATRQATATTIFPTRDKMMIKSVAESMGRDPREILEIVHLLPPYHCLTIPKSVHSPMIITHPPKVV